VCRVVGHEDYGKFVMQYWEPQNAARDHKLKYKDCWTGIWIRKDRKPTMIHVDTVLFASYSKIQNPKTRRIPKRDWAMSSINLTRANAVEPWSLRMPLLTKGSSIALRFLEMQNLLAAKNFY
jgi:hypothetical protein